MVISLQKYNLDLSFAYDLRSTAAINLTFSAMLILKITRLLPISVMVA